MTSKSEDALTDKVNEAAVDLFTRYQMAVEMQHAITAWESWLIYLGLPIDEERGSEAYTAAVDAKRAALATASERNEGCRVPPPAAVPPQASGTSEGPGAETQAVACWGVRSATGKYEQRLFGSQVDAETEAARLNAPGAGNEANAGVEWYERMKADLLALQPFTVVPLVPASALAAARDAERERCAKEVERQAFASKTGIDLRGCKPEVVIKNVAAALRALAATGASGG